MLKSTSGWMDNGNGTDDFGFSAVAANGAVVIFLAQHEGIYNTFMRLNKDYNTADVGHGGTIDPTEGYPIRCIAEETTGSE